MCKCASVQRSVSQPVPRHPFLESGAILELCNADLTSRIFVVAGTLLPWPAITGAEGGTDGDRFTRRRRPSRCTHGEREEGGESHLRHLSTIRSPSALRGIPFKSECELEGKGWSMEHGSRLKAQTLYATAVALFSLRLATGARVIHRRDGRRASSVFCHCCHCCHCCHFCHLPHPRPIGLF